MRSCLCKGSGSSLPFQPHPNSYHPIHNNKGHLGGMLAQKLRPSATSPEPQKVTTSLCVNWWESDSSSHPPPSSLPAPHLLSISLSSLLSQGQRASLLPNNGLNLAFLLGSPLNLYKCFSWKTLPNSLGLTAEAALRPTVLH